MKYASEKAVFSALLSKPAELWFLKYVAKETQLPEIHVMRCLRQLEEDGFVEAVQTGIICPQYLAIGYKVRP